MKKNYFLLLLLVLMLSSCDLYQSQDESFSKEAIEISDDFKLDSIDLEVRKEKLKTYLNQTSKLNDDTLKKKNYLHASYYAASIDSALFLEANSKAIAYATRLNDSLGLAGAFWDRGYFYSEIGGYRQSYDAYQEASELYLKNDKPVLGGRLLINMAILQSDIKDYVGSEVTTVKALKVLKPLDAKEYVYRCYNNLAVAYNQMNDFENSLEYHMKAYEIQKQLGNNIYQKASTLNNIGVLYENMGRFDDALNAYAEALEFSELENKEPQVYAKIIDNRAFAEFKIGKKEHIPEDFYKALQLRESIGDEDGAIFSSIHLAEYYENIDKSKALKYAEKSKKLARRREHMQGLMESLRLEARLDKANSYEHLERYIYLKDSLEREERAARNQFARIRYETDEFIEQNKYLNAQRKWIILGAGFLLIIVILGFVVRHQKIKNRQLKLEKLQQQSNEEIYNLLIDQQNKLEEGRQKEKKRIAAELHDGILGKIFGIRLILSSLNDKVDADSVETRSNYIAELKMLGEEVRSISHDLDANIFDSRSGFISMLNELLNEQSTLGKFEAVLNNDPNIEWDKISSKIKINLFRVMQESTYNITKYAQAKKVIVVFRKQDTHLFAMIKDDGKGFDLDANSKGIGLKNMKSRINNLNGKINFKTSEEGTAISIQIPINQNHRIWLTA
ncbi:tetratricopeptide repeat-containing sensor histidine kinase [Zunongwangia sp. HGR-M22]|uniref:tetratricopeptide repeat-containing sensor histidine kinase n=1 Tax=Zunongwangia sp. HGR-M22 TaxID=3015168 RepID=UPI0022DD4E42|nr:tetratricopeptide repeat protein [Zunongwangia sp. HGR-M22]WBL26580.1 tetratricopeptide repeat protein [Zunongwangia sp. HGR-M22]